jgi:hypothetical protein
VEGTLGETVSDGAGGTRVGESILQQKTLSRDVLEVSKWLSNA